MSKKSIVMNTPKDNEKSIEFRKTGNLHFAKKTSQDYLIALKWYNKAICFASNNSENVCIGYANRSAVYFNLGMYEECLVNINLVYKINRYPSNLMDKLREREVMCKRIMAEDEYDSKYEQAKPKLSFPAHEQLSCMGNCLDIRKNDEYGEHVTTNRDLRVGEIVAILQPFYTVLPKRYQYERCENCCKERSQNLIPCPTCTTVMFCDEQCLKEATDHFHKYECPVIDLLGLQWLSDKLVIRILMNGLSAFETIDQFLIFSDKALKRNLNIFDITENDDKYKHKYQIVCSLKKAITKDTIRMDTMNLFHLCDKIINANKIAPKLPPDEFTKMLKNTVKQLLLMVEQSATSFYDLSNHIVNMRSSSYDVKNQNNNMMAIYPFMNLLTHSCLPNVVTTTTGTRTITSIIRPIKAGDPLMANF